MIKRSSQRNAHEDALLQRVAEICAKLAADGLEHIAVIGDFNDTPESEPLAPLLTNTKLKLKDIWEHKRFDNVNENRSGTYGNCTESNKIDYILLSPSLFESVEAAGVNRSGIWAGKNGDLFPHIDEVTKASEAASDHAALWVDVAL